ncbi:MAG: CvpA family protein [Sinimarinibacterium flocculans]|uniref:CvpA family protein n=1 Tax=Sinimarinibacterium flocculans TaxID=985250 RepID=UPI002E9A9110|nr:CvpA family protein [Pseudomonadota bacterium]
MTWVDYSILGVFVISVLLGVWRGLTREVLSLLTWIAAFVVAWMFHRPAAAMIAPYIPDPVLSMAAACAGVFLLALLVGALLTHLLVTVVRESGFSPADRTLGGGLGMVRAVIVVSLFVLVGGRMGAAEAGWWQESALIGQFEPLAQGFANVMPEAWLEMIKPTANPNPSPGP